MDDVTVGRNGPYGDSGVAIPEQSLMSMNALLVWCCMSKTYNQVSVKMAILIHPHLGLFNINIEGDLVEISPKCSVEGN